MPALCQRVGVSGEHPRQGALAHEESKQGGETGVIVRGDPGEHAAGGADHSSSLRLSCFIHEVGAIPGLF